MRAGSQRFIREGLTTRRPRNIALRARFTSHLGVWTRPVFRPQFIRRGAHSVERSGDGGQDLL